MKWKENKICRTKNTKEKDTEGAINEKKSHGKNFVIKAETFI